DLQRGKSAAQAESVILRELERLAREPVGQQELDRAKNLVLFQLYSELQGNDAKASFIGRYETTLGSYSKAMDQIHSISALQPTDLLRVAQAWFKPSSRTVITGVPK
ncbi:MAG: insulinase family protein, partial [Bdellovibrionales bacterium]|nr:insulinase family protein [Bdellovibrionales bacterium]